MKINKSQLRYFIIIPLLAFSSLLNASIEMSLHLKIVDLKNAGPPEFFGDNIIFTYKNSHPVRFVGAIFEHEGYSITHVYQKNQHNVFFLIYQKPSHLTKLKYRIIVDGLIMRDPYNPLIEIDILSVEYSIVEVTVLPEIPIKNPGKMGNGEISFILRTIPGRNVSIVGDFNDWDPFMHILKEAPSGYYRISLRVTKGKHYYYFIVDGEKRLDPYNLSRMINFQGEEVCTFDIP
jgi:hypothetical protein